MLKLFIPKSLLTSIHEAKGKKYSLPSYILRCVNYIIVNNIPTSTLYSTTSIKEVNEGNNIHDRVKDNERRGKDANHNTM